MQIVIDMETRSPADLKKCGAYVYAEDPSTEILCIAVKVDDLESSVYFDEYSPVAELAVEADTIIAHNAGFEAAMWHEVMHKRYGYNDIPAHKWKCTAAKAASHALPRSLEGACSALGLSQQKNMEGKRIMMKWCKPWKITKNNPKEWHDDPEEFIKLCEYCIQDVEAEYELDKALYDLSPNEQKVWLLDQKINSRGIYIDLEAVNNLMSKVKEKEKLLLKEVKNITEGEITSVRQVAKTLKFLQSKGLSLPDLTKNTVSEALSGNIDLKARRILEIRQSLGKSSVSKLDAMKKRACADSRVRGTIMYHGASTGRFAGKGIQIQNYPRDTYSSEHIENIIACDNSLIEILYGCPILSASKCLRGMIAAEKGNILYCADFSSIEARVLAWMAEDYGILNAFKNNLDLYKVVASDIYGISYENINKDQRFIGKTATLALGYQGWSGAFLAMAEAYGVTISEEEAADICGRWRKAHPKIVSYWKEVEKAAVNTVKTGEVNCFGKVKFGMRNGFLCIRLPSGRLINYYKPEVSDSTTKYGQVKETVSFMGIDTYTKKWTRLKTYGGKLTENCFSGNTLVITNRGCIRISEIRKTDLLWDGLQWVKHCGVINKGIKEVGLWLGILITQEHLIHDGNSWREVIDLTEEHSQECLRSGRSLVNSLLLSPEGVTTASPYVYVSAEESIQLKQGLSLEIPRINAPNVLSEMQEKKGKNTKSSFLLRMLNLFGVTGIRALYQGVMILIIKHIKFMAAEGLNAASFGKRIELHFLNMLSHLRGIKILNLIWIELITKKIMNPEIYGLYHAEKTVETKETQPTLYMGERKSLTESSGKNTAPYGQVPMQSDITLKKEKVRNGLWQDTGKRTEVYDIINSGPNHRYMIVTNKGPVLVHNCIQAVARDILTEALIRLEKSGFPMVAHIHDEVISELPENTNKTLNEFISIMSENPRWAEGLPLAAEGWKGKRYRK